MCQAASAPARRAHHSFPHAAVLLRGCLLTVFVHSIALCPAMAQEKAPLPALEKPTETLTAQTPASQSWLMYKGDAQRTGSSNSDSKPPLNLVWQHSTAGEAQANFSSPLVAGPNGQKRVYFDVGNFVYCVDAQTGAQVWKSIELASSLAAPVTFMSTEGGDMLLAATYGGRFYALRASDGAPIWAAEAGTAIANTAPTLVKTPRGDRILLGTGTGHIIAFSREGQLDTDWDIQLGNYGSSPTASPVVSADGVRVFVAAQDSKLYAIEVANRKVYFALPLGASTRSTPMILNGVLVVTAGTRVLAYKENIGASLWQEDVKSTMIASPAGLLAADGTGSVFIGTSRGLFMALDLQTGRKKWESDLQTTITGTPLVLPNMVLVGTSNGMLFGFDPADGTRKWQYRINTARRIPSSTPAATTATQPGRGGLGSGRGGRGGRGGQPVVPAPEKIYGVSSAPSVSGDQVFVLADNAAMYAFSTRAFDADPPNVVEPTISVMSQEKRLQETILQARRPALIPGTGPIYFAVKLQDEGSGVDENSLRVTLNGKTLGDDDIIYQPALGVLSARLLKSGVPNLPDATYTLAVVARDYYGNEMNYTATFVVDNSLAPPSAPAPLPTTNTTTGGRPNTGPTLIQPGMGQPEMDQPDDNGPDDKAPDDKAPDDKAPDDNAPDDKAPDDDQN